jgi:hypothetical protein
VALGAPGSVANEHLNFVATQPGFPANFDSDREGLLANGDPLDAAPTKADVDLAVFLLFGRKPALTEIARLLREHRGLRSLITEWLKTTPSYRPTLACCRRSTATTRAPHKRLEKCNDVRRSGPVGADPIGSAG